MDFAPSPKTQDYLERLRAFIAEHVTPREADYRREVAVMAGADWTHWQVPQLMQEWKAQGKTLLVITHDEELAANWCDRVIRWDDTEGV